MRHAFTLVEVLVTVTLLAIMATMVVPVVSGGNDSFRVSSTARMVMSDLMYVQNCAVTQQKNTWVIFSADKQCFSVVAMDTPPVTADLPTAEQAAKPSTYTKGQILKQPTTQSGYYVTFGSGAASPLDRTKADTTHTIFGYNPLGSPLAADGTELMDPVKITISNLRDGSHTTILTITPLTGEITVQ